MKRILGWNARAAVGSRIPEVALALASVAFAYVVLEFVVFPALLPSVPLALQPYLPREIQFLAQSSKAGLVPHDYVAITGDSYAQGLGDWLLSVNPRRNEPFHSAHVVHEQTGRDVVSLGRGGAGSFGGGALRPVRHLLRIASVGRFDVAPPTAVIVYYYEGNDLLDSLLEVQTLLVEARGGSAPQPDEGLARALAKRGDETEVLQDDVRLRALLEAGLASKTEVVADQPAALESLYFARSVGALLQGESERLFPRWSDPAAEWERWKKAGQGPIVRVAGIDEKLPRPLQGPPFLQAVDEAAFEIGARVFSESLRLLLERLPTAEVCVVYIPSPLAIYEVVEIRQPARAVGSDDEPRQPIGVDDIEAAHARLRGRVAAVAAREGVRFVDATPELRAVGRGRLIHGPLDWNHFNRSGYEVLGTAVAGCLAPDRV